MILVMMKMRMVIMMIKMVDNTADDDGSDGADHGDTDVDADADDHENMDNDTTKHDDADNNMQTMIQWQKVIICYNSICRQLVNTATATRRKYKPMRQLAHTRKCKI